MRAKLLALPLFGLLLISSTSAFAQQGSGEVRKIKYDFEPVVISGNVEKPQVQYFISREKIRDVTPLDLKESFLDRILKAVEKNPF